VRTAHSVLNLNNEDGGNRKFIMVQLQEPTDENSEAFMAGYKNIAEIGKERIRRVIKKIKDENDGKLEFDGKKLDLGFKVLKLDESNFKIWDKKSDQPLNEQLQLSVDNIDSNSTDDDILYEIILKSGFPLTIPIEKLDIQGKTVYSIDDKSLLVCLENDLNQDLMKELSKLEAGRVICLDRGFNGSDELKTNTVEIMKTRGIEFKTV
jgi:adenine-specific DNA-methyltransferase